MTKKDFVLIQDAINEGIETFFNGYLVGNDMKVRHFMTERDLRSKLARSLAKHLKYTADAFDPITFSKAITDKKILEYGTGNLV